MADLADAGAGALLELFRTRRASPLEAVEACLRRIESIDPLINAVLTLCADAALEAAEASTRRWVSNAARPLEGVPFGLKDVVATRGIRTTGGSGFLGDSVPAADASVARRLADAGAVLVAKLQTFSFALGGPNNRAFGVTRNPWDLRRIAGGSSSGPAAAVAARMLPLAIGTDTGGSIRLPAAYCGITGLRPTFGRISRDGVMLLTWTLDVVGPMARSALDCARALPALTGVDASVAAADLRRVRLGVPRKWFYDVCDPDVAAAIDAAASTMSALGASIVEIELPHAHLADAIGRTIVTVEAGSLHEPMLDRIDEYDPSLAERVLAAHFVGALDYVRSLRLLRLIRQDFASAFEQVDVVVTPASATVAPLVDDPSVRVAGGSAPWRDIVTRTTFPISLAGLPAISVPAGFTPEGLPVGLQIAAPAMADEACLAIAAAYEAETGFATWAPSMLTRSADPDVHTRT